MCDYAPSCYGFNLSHVAPRLRPIAEAFGVDTYSLTDIEGATEEINSVVSLMKSLEMSTALKYTSKFGKDRLLDVLEYILN